MSAPLLYSDTSGKQTLSSISKAIAFNKWMYSKIEPHTKGKILEIGSGIGNISEFFIKNKKDIHLSDIQEDYLEILQAKFTQETISIQFIDIAEANFDEHYYHLFNSFDTVFCLNVVEHIEDDRLAMDNLNKLLKPGGKLIVLVPAFTLLYNRLDKSLGHYKRYHSKSLLKLLPRDIRIQTHFYFNAVGILAWILGGAIFKFDAVPEGNMSFYNRFVSVWKIIDKIVGKWLGLSLIVIGEKSE